MKHKLLKLVCEAMQADCSGVCTYMSTGHCRKCERIVDHLTANGVTVGPARIPRPEPDLTGKCGSCAHAASTKAYGGAKSYVECTNKEHLQRYCDTRGRYTATRPRTTKGCKLYTPKEAEDG